jgi:hypothetical protein
MPTTFGTIQTMKRASQQTDAGEGPWIVLGNFRNAWYGYAKDIRFSLVEEPLDDPAEKTARKKHEGRQKRWRDRHKGSAGCF